MFKVATNGLLEADDLNVGEGSGYPELVDEGEDCAGGDTAAAEGDEGEEAGVVPSADDGVVDQGFDFPLGEDGAGDSETSEPIRL